MKAILQTAPTFEPVTVEEVKGHLRIDSTDEYELIVSLIASARETVEDWTRRAIITQTWDYYLDAFPRENYITLPFGNLQSDPLGNPVVAAPVVTYRNSDGTYTTLSSSSYAVEKNGEGHGRIVLGYGEVWPSVALYPSNPVSVRFICGWTTAALVPAKINTAIKMLCADMFEMRGEPTIGQTVVENKTVERLLASTRLWGDFA